MTEFAASRRDFLTAAGVAGAASLLRASIARADDDSSALAQDAFIRGVPLVLSGRYSELAKKAGLGFNTFYLSPDLATPAPHAAGPNIDTLYGFAWLDLAVGPQVIAVPEIRNRYCSIQSLDTYGDSFSYIGSRATGTKAGAYAVTAPGWKGALPAGDTAIPAPTAKVLALVRTLVAGRSDLAAARAIHASYTTGSLAAWPTGRTSGVARTDSINVLPVFDGSYKLPPLDIVSGAAPR
ncbi:MAG: DUF1254 domain-containing protein [Novosphingobium sp.]|nr:DUF1254 domain-containing protein [Novosphingobium sp.]